MGPMTSQPIKPELAQAPGDPKASPALAVPALALLAAIWGYNWVIMKVALRYAQPFTFAALRTFLAAVVLLPLLPLSGRPLRPKALGLTLLIALSQTTGSVGLAIWALARGGAGKTSVLVYTMPFWLLLLAWTILGERLQRFQWLSVGLASAGFVLVLTPWRLSGALSTLLALAAGCSWAASAVTVKVLQTRHEVDLLSLTAWQMLLGSVPLMLVAALTYEAAPIWSASFVGALAFNVVVANAAGWFLWLYALRRLSAGAAGLGTLIIPVIGVVSAWLQLGERPGVSEGAGMLLILGALGILTLRGIVVERRPSGTLLPPPD